jgi:hypothetical protein
MVAWPRQRLLVALRRDSGYLSRCAATAATCRAAPRQRLQPARAAMADMLDGAPEFVDLVVVAETLP